MMRNRARNEQPGNKRAIDNIGGEFDITDDDANVVA